MDQTTKRWAVLLETQEDGTTFVIFAGRPGKMPVRWIQPETGEVVNWTAEDCQDSGTPMDAEADVDFEVLD